MICQKTITKSRQQWWLWRAQLWWEYTGEWMKNKGRLTIDIPESIWGHVWAPQIIFPMSSGKLYIFPQPILNLRTSIFETGCKNQAKFQLILELCLRDTFVFFHSVSSAHRVGFLRAMGWSDQAFPSCVSAKSDGSMKKLKQTSGIYSF